MTIAITHEQNNEAMAITESLLGRLRRSGDGGKGNRTSRGTSRPRGLLVELERSFLDPGKAGTIKPGGALRLIEASRGAAKEAEAIGAEIAGLVSNGTDPGEIAIAIDAPGDQRDRASGGAHRYEIPAMLEAETTAPESAIGQSAINFLLATARNGPADRLFAWLRGPLGLDPDLIDQLEFRAVRSGTERAGSDRSDEPGSAPRAAWPRRGENGDRPRRSDWLCDTEQGFCWPSGRIRSLPLRSPPRPRWRVRSAVPARAGRDSATTSRPGS